MKLLQVAWWCNSKALDSRLIDHEFDSRPGCYQITTLGTPMCLCYQAV